ncbi:hypothetical protein CBER1_06018 [Cercospora berteroae]|uniref:FAD/NAD(P)-binding domain-containing protein n=1 Tax=Cercospora berteroae TaxID=357750 RepID=A0A2S6C4N5_9PEZI|nr:hypothetical protein CBER1_06018 [Cercospora berteroae]
MTNAKTLQQRYEQERAKRLRSDGTAQYIDARSKEVEGLAKDPWVDHKDPRIQNPPLKDGSKIKFLIAGCGHHGLLSAARLIDAGFSNNDIVNVDNAGGFGGTWYWNRYPGLMCDVEGYCYLPLLEETGYIPKHRFPYGAEIREQNERAAKHHALQAQFCTRVDSYVWDALRGHWNVEMTRRIEEHEKLFTVHAQFVILAGGVLHIPKLPNLPGLQEFRANKHIFHTARWDYDYTGGRQEHLDMVNLKDKTIAILGTGATAVQAVPALAKWAKHLYVVQRTPSYCGVRSQTETDAAMMEQLSQKGWQKKRRTNLAAYMANSGDEYGPDLVNDGWTHTPAGAGLLGSKGSIIEAKDINVHIDRYFELDKERTALVRQRVDDIVKNKTTAEQLKPWYNSWCKRPTFNDDYLEAFNKFNATLIDTNGKEYEIDALVLATGFTPTTFEASSPASGLGATILGVNGLNMNDKWNSMQDPPLWGLTKSEFPNMFGWYETGSGVSYNLTGIYDATSQHVAHILAKANENTNPGDKVVIESTKEAEKQWGNEVAKRANFFALLPTCTPSYFTSEGKYSVKRLSPEEESRMARLVAWGGGPVEWQEILEAYQEKGNLEGLRVTATA